MEGLVSGGRGIVEERVSAEGDIVEGRKSTAGYIVDGSESARGDKVEVRVSAGGVEWKGVCRQKGIRLFPPRLIPLDVSAPHGAFPRGVFPWPIPPLQSKLLTLAPPSGHSHLIAYSPLACSPHRLIPQLHSLFSIAFFASLAHFLPQLFSSLTR